MRASSVFLITESHPEVRITLILMHGDADAFTTKVLSFPDNDAGHAQAALALLTIPLMSEVIARYREASTEEDCAKVARQLLPETAPEADLMRLFEAAVICDSTCDEYTAPWVAMTIERQTPTGTQRGLFGTGNQKKRYQVLHPIHESYLKQWA